MRDIITGYTLASAPTLYHTAGQISLDPGDVLNFRLSEQRYCTGYDDPAGGMFSCPEASEAVQSTQCLACVERALREVCHACTGRTCGNPARYKTCVPVEHFVYLAFYRDDLIKVGVTKAERLRTRIVEQGAWAAIPIAQAGGQEARRIEHEVAMAGWVDRTKMLPLLVDEAPERERCEQLLRMELIKVAQRLPDIRFMKDGPLVWAAERYPAALVHPPRQLDPRTDPLAGRVLGVRGSYLLLDVEVETVACSLRALPGRELTRVEGELVLGPAQRALIF